MENNVYYSILIIILELECTKEGDTDEFQIENPFPVLINYSLGSIE
jgi:hypothetical protein